MNLTVSRGRLAVLMALAFMSVAKGLHAQDAAKRFDLELQTPQRLSNWLGTHADALQGSEPLGLAWATPEERQRQTAQRNADVAWLRHALLRPDESVLWRWLATAPVTGRVVLPASVAPWLEGVPARDPVLRPGDGLWVAPAGQPVRVLDGSGHGCALAHQPGGALVQAGGVDQQDHVGRGGGAFGLQAGDDAGVVGVDPVDADAGGLGEVGVERLVGGVVAGGVQVQHLLLGMCGEAAGQQQAEGGKGEAGHGRVLQGFQINRP